MRIHLVCTLSASMLALSGCIGTDDYSDPITDTLARTPLMYKPDIQQGNVVTQAQINKLEPGMDRRQVRFIMGTPMLMDTFHQDRWDYVYTMKPGGKQTEMKRVALYFKDDRLMKIEGDFRPGVDDGSAEKEALVRVPDHKEESGFVDSTLKSIGLRDKTKRIEDIQKEEEKTEKAVEEATKNTEEAKTEALTQAGEAVKEAVVEEAKKAEAAASE